MAGHWRLGAAVAGAGVAILLAGCGSSTSSSPGTGSGGGGSAVPSAKASSVANPNAIINYTQYVNGKAGKANSSLSPVTVGWINEQGGPSSVAPEATTGAQAAIWYLNNEAGGIDGHPVQLQTCFTPDTVDTAARCGTQMADASNVAAVGTGSVSIGNAAMEAALAPQHKPVAFNFANGASDASYNPGFVLYGSSYTGEAPFASLAQALHVKAVTILYRQTPGIQLGIDNILEAFKATGIKVLHSVGYDQNATDLLPALEASDYSKAGLIVWPEGSTSGCNAIYKAIKTLSITTPIVSAVPCNSPTVAPGDGGTLPDGWYYLSDSDIWNPSTPESQAFQKVMDSYGQSKLAGDAWVEDSFSQVLTIAKWYDAVLVAGKPLTPANVAAAGKADKSGIPFGAPHLVCGVYAAEGLPNLCDNEALMVQDQNGNFVAVFGGWHGVPAGYKPVLQ